MTPAERAVLARYPDAECWRDGAKGEFWRQWRYVIMTRTPSAATMTLRPDTDRSGDFVVGTGPTPDAAWADAAARLTTEGK